MVVVPQAIGIFLDLSKAFDSVNHDILLNKLSYYCIKNDTLSWFESYLSNRLHYVSIDNENSEYLPITCGSWIQSIINPWTYLISDLRKAKSLKSHVAHGAGAYLRFL